MIIFGGDLLEAITNGAYRATRHRVTLYPPRAGDEAAAAAARLPARLARPLFLRSHAEALVPRHVLQRFWPGAACRV